jgi:glycosyltransferase involved in cell wall biosynthesis
LITYQLGNASCHDFMWAYLVRYPGLVVVHDPRLHHARARHLLSQGRFDDYRREFWYDHPDACRDFAEYAVEGLGGPIYYNWSMLRVVMETARLVAVHNPRVAADLRDEYPGTRVETIHLGHPASSVPDPAARDRVRAALGVPAGSLLFGAFGKITAEKRIGTILRAFSAIVRDGADVHLVLAGDGSDYPGLAAETASPDIGPRVHVTGYLPDEAMGDHVAAADACLCLRWPTALETSASWLHCVAASRPTVISDLAHLVDIPTVDPRGWQPSPSAGNGPVAIAIDLLNEEESLRLAMHRLATDEQLRNTLGRAGHLYWKANHTLDQMVDDYRRLFELAVDRPAPAPADLPAHFTADHSSLARDIASQFGLEIDRVLPATGRPQGSSPT